MLGHRGIAQAQELREITNRALAVDQLANDQEPVPVGKRLQKVARPVCRGFHNSNVNFHTCVYTIMRIYSQALGKTSHAQEWRNRRSRGMQQTEADMAEVVVLGAGLSGTLMAYELLPQ